VWLGRVADKRFAQQSMSRSLIILPLAVLLVIVPGCSQGPKRVPMPEFAPDGVAGQALAALDSDGNGMLNRVELSGSPGLLSSLTIFDEDGDQQITRQELATELRKWQDEKAGLIPLSCEVTWKGRPLNGATVRLIPEPFFDGAIAPAMGQTDQNGQAEMSCDREHLPEALKSLRAVQPGIYRVEVTHPEIQLPAEYNTDTRLGRSVSLRNNYLLKLDL
jgi:hypothetical protein